jgi:hypothetical protein
MRKPVDPINNLRVAKPCPVDWNSMSGDERARLCALCNLHVYNIVEMRSDEVRELITRTEGNFCARLFQRLDGTVLTRDCPAGLRAVGARVARIASAALAAVLGLATLGFSQSSVHETWDRVNRSRIRIKAAAASKPKVAPLSGIVTSRWRPLSRAVITLRNEATNEEFTFESGADGTFVVDAIADGSYRIVITHDATNAAVADHVKVNAGRTIRATIDLQYNPYAIQGIVVLPYPPIEIEPGKATLEERKVNALPL